MFVDLFFIAGDQRELIGANTDKNIDKNNSNVDFPVEENLPRTATF